MKKCDNHPDHEVDETKEGSWFTEIFIYQDEDSVYRKYQATMFICDECQGDGISDYPWTVHQEPIAEGTQEGILEK